MRMVVASLLVVAACALPAVAGAEHTGESPSVDLNFDLKLEDDGFRVGGRFFGLGGEWGAWLNGYRRRHGFTLDGVFKHPERSFDFKFDTDLPEWLLRLMPPSRSVI